MKSTELYNRNEEAETLNENLAEVSKEELEHVVGGKNLLMYYYCRHCHQKVIVPVHTESGVICNRCGGPIISVETHFKGK